MAFTVTRVSLLLIFALNCRYSIVQSSITAWVWAGFEPPTSPLSGVRSNQLSYRPIQNIEPSLILCKTIPLLPSPRPETAGNQIANRKRVVGLGENRRTLIKGCALNELYPIQRTESRRRGDEF